MNLYRLKNRFLAKIATRVPWVADRLVKAAGCAMDVGELACGGPVPWSPPSKPLCKSRVALVSTAGVHHSWQDPFDMKDPDGDPSFREIGSHGNDLTITHDYYDHTDADLDINIVFPFERLHELVREGVVGEVAAAHYSFMGHITGPHVGTLINRTAPEVARRLKADKVDVVLLTPG